MSLVNVKMFKKVVALLTMSLVLASFGFVSTARADGISDLTDDEKAAFIVRDEWTSWVKAFTASLSELDKLATAKIYDDMDFYDMQYRFTEKYKKVPEFLDEDGKPTQKLKDMIKEKRKKIAKGGSGSKTNDYLHFKSTKDGSKLKYVINGTLAAAPNIGYSLDNGDTWVIWSANTDVTVDNGNTVLVQNKAETLSSSEADYVQFVMTDATFEVSGDCSSMIHYANPTPY